MSQATIDQAMQQAVQLHQQGRLAEAESIYRQVLAQSPNHADALHLLGVLAGEVGQKDAAMELIQRALALRPNEGVYFNNLGKLFADALRLDEAIPCFRDALKGTPDSPEVLCNLGHVLKDNGELDESIACFRRAIALQPHNAGIHSSLLMTLNYHPDSDWRSLLEEARHWADLHGRPLEVAIQPYSVDRDPGRRLRIGYVSADYRQHPCAYLQRPLFQHHDRRQVEVICYAEVAKPDEMTKELQEKSDVWRSTVGLDDERMAEMIREDRIDILVDLKLHTDNNRLCVFARKPAPVQVTWMGYPGTTGLTAIDYRLTDPYLDPPGGEGHDEWYAEKSIRLPDTFWCHDAMMSDLPVNDLPMRHHGRVTFGCLNSAPKINDFTLGLWAQVLHAVPGSRMMMLTAGESHRQRMREAWQRLGIASDRVEFAEQRPRRKYLELYQRIDVGLDALPYNGHTTSLDSFWMGVPVITLVGRTVVGRAGLCELMNLGLPELVAHTPEEFVRIATGLASDPVSLAALRSGLRLRMETSPLMDGPRIARNIEAVYRTIWKRWCTEQPGS